MIERYTLADVDGVLCVRFESSDYNEPRLVAHYWPTVASTRDLLYTYDETDLAAFTCVKSRPGEYFIGIKDVGFGASWKRGQHIRLTDGGHTQPIKTDLTPVVQPKTRKGTTMYWSGGYWVKHTSKGVEKIEPVAA